MTATPARLTSVVAPDGFFDGLLLGLGAAGLWFAGLLPRPAPRRAGVEADWRSVGRDLGGM